MSSEETEINKDFKTFINDLVSYQINKCPIKPVAEHLQQNQEGIVEYLAQCYEIAPENELADYVWNNIKPDCKFIDVTYVVAKFAEYLEKNRSKLVITPATSNTKRTMLKRHHCTPDESEPLPKRSMGNGLSLSDATPPIMVVDDSNDRSISEVPSKNPSAIQACKKVIAFLYSNVISLQRHTRPSTISLTSSHEELQNAQPQDCGHHIPTSHEPKLAQNNNSNEDEIMFTTAEQDIRESYNVNADQYETLSTDEEDIEESEKEDTEESEEEENIHVSRPRDFSHYARYCKSYQ